MARESSISRWWFAQSGQHRISVKRSREEAVEVGTGWQRRSQRTRTRNCAGCRRLCHRIEDHRWSKGKPGRLLETRWGNNRLFGFDATTDGVDFSYGDGKAARYYVDGLEKKGNALRWNVRVNESGKLDVSILYIYSTAKPSVATGSQFVVHLGSQTLTASIVATGSPTKMQTLHMGELSLQPSMLQDLSVTMTEGADKIHFFEVDLKPLLRSEVEPSKK